MKTDKCYDAALKYLETRPRTYYETVKRLKERGFEADEITRAMELVLKYGYIDDKQYAQEYALSRIGTGNFGPRRIKQELRLKGIDGALIDGAIARAMESHDETEAAKGFIMKKRVDLSSLDIKGRKRLSDMLARRGFSYSAIKTALSGEDDE